MLNDEIEGDIIKKIQIRQKIKFLPNSCRLRTSTGQ